MNLFSQALASGVMSGVLYALLGMGMVISFRTTRLLNLAHGESFVVAGIVSALLLSAGVPYPIALVASVVSAVAIAMYLQHFVLRPRAGWSPGTLILITLGAAFVIRGLLFVLVGSDPVSFPPAIDGPPLRGFGAAVPRQGLALIIIGIVSSASAALFLTRSRFGKRLMATAENPFAAQLVGIDVDKARLVGFGVAAALSAIAGVLLIPLIAVDFQAGLPMTLRGFIAAAISGMSPFGVLPAGILLGLFETLVGTYLGALAQDPVIFLLLIAVAVWQTRKIRYGGVKRA